MPDDLVALLLLEEILAARERRLLVREERRMLRVEMARRVVLPIAGLVLLALGAFGLSVPR